MNDVTLILKQISQGQARAHQDLFPRVYEELRRMASGKMMTERVDHTLSATALVHEAYVRLVDTDALRHWDSRAHFFSAAAEAMRRILIDHAPRSSTGKRGGNYQWVNADGFAASVVADPGLLFYVDQGISRLAKEDMETLAADVEIAIRSVIDPASFLYSAACLRNERIDELVYACTFRGNRVTNRDFR